jgi:L-Ala-D/L-Glu epimerase
MKLSHKLYLLEFKHPFGVSSNVRMETPSVFVMLEAENKKGYGEACLPLYLGETVEATVSFLNKAGKFLENFDPTLPIEHFIKEIDDLEPDRNAAKAAIDVALHDLYGKLENKPLYKLLGFKKSEPMITSFTIGIDTEKKVEQKIKEAEDFKLLKIKLGTANDKELIGMIRKFTDKPLYVDVNQGWKDKEFVLDMMRWMKEQGVILVEQPMPVNMKTEMTWVTSHSILPTIADESVKRLKDLEQLNGAFSGINIKLMKCTGLHEALKMITFCKENNLKVLLGCMAESSCATTAMAHLMQFADYIDLDAPQLYKNDPFEGVTYKNGKVYLNDLAGVGATSKIDLFN